ncbi:MAG: hypothetical protein CFK49_07465 [Armatimonadetes bacterium JP3_11]|nr:MAG: hypothetical protein CFK49_07465 [Armatimonadetes bacterium JP3_11]RMH07857.1 MAG: hypothetical protein D6697_07665 [Armatimonadota bacterium]
MGGSVVFLAFGHRAQAYSAVGVFIRFRPEIARHTAPKLAHYRRHRLFVVDCQGVQSFRALRVVGRGEAHQDAARHRTQPDAD